jgi:hypothetical protein
VDSVEFEALLLACAEVAELFPDGVVFIGGIAVYLHAINVASTADLAETTHDADFYISLADMADLRDIEEVTTNRRLSKHQMVKRGFEFDIYTERQSTLLVPYDVVVASSTVIGGIRVAALEHLLILKVEAYADRRASAKGAKDAKDLIRIASVATRGPRDFGPDRAIPYLRDEHLPLLREVERGAFALALARGNAMVAKRLRADLSAVIGALAKT